MLCSDSSLFIIYPSWATPHLKYQWSELPRFLEDPRASPFLTENEETYRRFNFSLQPASELQFWAGCDGGGIIKVTTPPDGRWLGTQVFVETNIRSPDEMTPAIRDGLFQCYYLEPRDHFYNSLGKRVSVPLHLCRLTVQHVQDAGDAIYWAVRHTATGKSQLMIDRMCSTEFFDGLDVSCRRCDDIPERVSRESEKWFSHPKYTTTWIEVVVEARSSGVHAAILTYVSFAMKSQFRASLSSAHLVAECDIPVDGIRKGVPQQW